MRSSTVYEKKFAAASGEAARSTCFACRDLDLIKNFGAKIDAVNGLFAL